MQQKMQNRTEKWLTIIALNNNQHCSVKGYGTAEISSDEVVTCNADLLCNSEGM